MKQITDIVPQKNDKKRVNLYVDGAFFFGAQKIVLLSENLHIGDYVDEKKLTEILDESEYDACFQKASSYVLKGGHTVKQVAGYLSSKGFDGKVVKKVIDKLSSYGYLDDEQFAKTYVDIKKNKHGKKLLAVELKLKGVDEKFIDAALDTIGDEDENAYLVAKKYVKDKPLDLALKNKCFRYVLSKGYSYDSAKSALDRLGAFSGENDF